MEGEMDWIAARFLLSTILGVHPLVALDDGARDDECFPVDEHAGVRMAAVEAPQGLAATCAVCTEDVAPGQAAARLPCAHWYHAACIAPWLRIRTTCPTCRAELLPREEEAEAAGGRLLRREASYTMLAGTLPS
jgi:E3 ubiquitin-protein ligase RNF181